MIQNSPRRPRARRLAVAALMALAATGAQAQQAARIVRGDVNGDGRVSSADALLVSAHLAGRPLPAGADVIGRGDADGDGVITRADAELILRRVVGQDVSATALGSPSAPSGPAALTCRVSVRGGSVQCDAPQSSPAASLLADRVVYGGQHRYVTLLTSNAAIDSAARIFSFDLAVKNLLRQAIGTSDGVTADPEGVRVFLSGDIETTAGHGIVELDNADGRSTFTTADQPYFQYVGVIAPDGVSAARGWRMRYGAGVENFRFTLYVSSPVQHLHGSVVVKPAAGEIAAGENLVLADTVLNPLGVPIAGAPVTWTTSDAAVATVSAAGVVTGVADGVATITATSGLRTGSMQVTVSTPSAARSDFAATPPSLAVHDTATITLQLRNAAGDSITRGGALPVFTTSLGTLTAVDSLGNGRFSARLTSPTLGVARVGGTLGGTPIADSVTVEFTAGAAAAYRVTAGSATVAAGGTVAITAQLVDAYGNPVPTSGTVATWSGTGGGSFAAPTSTTDSTGTASVVFTADTVAGTAHVLTATTSALTGSTPPVTVAVGAAARVVKVTADSTSLTVGGTMAPAPSVRVVDAYGNPVAGAGVTFAVASGGGALTGDTATTDAAGLATVGSWTLGTTVGTNTLTATAGPASATFTVTATAGAAANLTKTAGDSLTAVAGTAVATAPRVRVTDAHGNPVAGVSVAFTATGNGVVAGSPATTDTLGVAAVTSWTLRTAAGADSLVATAGALTATFTATATAGAPAAITKTGPDGVALAAGSAVTPPPSVRITDANGNPVPGVGVTFAVVSGGGAVAGDTATTGASGEAAVGSWTLGTAVGAGTLRATAGALTADFVITSTVGPVNAAASRITALNAALTAGSITTVTLQATDQYGNPVGTGGAAVTLATTLGTLGPVTDNGDGTYTADLTHTGTDGSAVVTGTMDGTALTDDATVSFQAGGILRTWTGLGGSGWSTAASWSPRGIATVADTIVVNPGATQPQITDGARTIGRLVMPSSGATLNLGGYTLTVTGDAAAPGGTVTNGTVAMTGSARTVQGTFPSLDISGGIATSGATTATGAVEISNGSLTVSGGTLTIRVP